MYGSIYLWNSRKKNHKIRIRKRIDWDNLNVIHNPLLGHWFQIKFYKCKKRKAK